MRQGILENGSQIRICPWCGGLIARNPALTRGTAQLGHLFNRFITAIAGLKLRRFRRTVATQTGAFPRVV